jgi:hypothetical protein
LRGGSSGRLAVYLLAAAFLILGICIRKLWLSPPFGVVTGAAAWAIVNARRADLAARRMQRRG